MPDITQDALKAAGWHRWEWNNGTLIEWWKGYLGPASLEGCYVGVPFDGKTGLRLDVRITALHCRLLVPGAETMETLEILPRALSWVDTDA